MYQVLLPVYQIYTYHYVPWSQVSDLNFSIQLTAVIVSRFYIRIRYDHRIIKQWPTAVMSLLRTECYISQQKYNNPARVSHLGKYTLYSNWHIMTALAFLVFTLLSRYVLLLVVGSNALSTRCWKRNGMHVEGTCRKYSFNNNQVS